MKKGEQVFLQFCPQECGRTGGRLAPPSSPSITSCCSLSKSFLHNPESVGFEQACVSTYSSCKFLGGFKTGSRYTQQKPRRKLGRNQWNSCRRPVTASPWNTLFSVGPSWHYIEQQFVKLRVKQMIKIGKRSIKKVVRQRTVKFKSPCSENCPC